MFQSTISRLSIFFIFQLLLISTTQAQKKKDFVQKLSTSYVVEHYLTNQIVTSYVGNSNRITKNQNKKITAIFNRYRTLKVEHEDLSVNQKNVLGVNDQVFNLFRWNLFIQNHYAESPSIFETTTPWDGLTPTVYTGLISKLSQQEVDHIAFVFNHQQKIYHQLETRLQARSDTDRVANKGLVLLRKAAFSDLEKTLVKEAESSTYGKGYKNYEAALAEELNCNSLGASFHYRLAITTNNHSKFNISYARLLFQHNNLQGAKEQLVQSDKTKNNSLNIQMQTLLGHISFTEGDFDQALLHYNKALSLSKSPNQETLQSLSVLQTAKGNYKRAIDYNKKLWTIEQRKYGSNHPVIAKRYQQIGNIYLTSRDTDKASHYYKAALKINQSYFGADNFRLANDYTLLAQLEIANKNFEGALYYLKLGLENEHKHNQGQFTQVVSLQNQIGVLYLENELPKLALAQFEISLGMLSETSDVALLSSVHYNLGLSYLSLHNKPAATLHFTKALELDKQVYPKNQPDIIVGYKSLNVYASSKEEHQMVNYQYKRIMNINPTGSWEFLPGLGTGYAVLSNSTSVCNNQNKTLEYFLKALAVDRGVLGEGHHDLGVDHNILGVLYHLQGDKQKALYHLQMAQKIYSFHLPDNHSYVINVNKRLRKIQ